MSEPRLRLVVVEVKAQFVVDDGETLKSAMLGPVAVQAADWPDFDLQAAAEKAMSEQTS